MRGQRFWVGNVLFTSAADSPTDKVTCAVCSKAMLPAKAAIHARVRHKGAAGLVLPGQLGLPFTETPDVPC